MSIGSEGSGQHPGQAAGEQNWLLSLHHLRSRGGTQERVSLEAGLTDLMLKKTKVIRSYGCPVGGSEFLFETILTNAWSSSFTAVVQEAHICQAVSIIHTTASLQDLHGVEQRSSTTPDQGPRIFLCRQTCAQPSVN